MCIVCLFSYEATIQYRLSRDLKYKMNERQEFILKNKSRSVLNVQSIESDHKLYSHFYKDHLDQNWIYECMSNYYQSGMIKIEANK